MLDALNLAGLSVAAGVGCPAPLAPPLPIEGGVPPGGAEASERQLRRSTSCAIWGLLHGAASLAPPPPTKGGVHRGR
jgi:hypothetical protein